MKRKTLFPLLLLLLLILILSGLLFLRRISPAGSLTPAPAASTPTVTAPLETAVPAPVQTAVITPEPTAAPTPFLPPQGYTEKTYNLVSDMVYAYADRQEAAGEIIRSDMDALHATDPALGALWGKIMDFWAFVNTALEINEGVLPDGLPEDESLCLVVLGFQLHADGSMSEELRGRCETALRCAEKYPNARIAVTGGGTAWQNPTVTEAGVMADWLAEHGVDRTRIITEDRSMTTGDNAAFTAAILREKYPQVKSLAIVSSDYHLPLGVLLFQEEAFLAEYETGALPFSVVSNAALHTNGGYSPDSPMSQRLYLWSLADPGY